MPTRRQILTGATATISAALLAEGIPAIADTLSGGTGSGDSGKQTITTPTTVARKTRAGRERVPTSGPVDYVGVRFDQKVPQAGRIRFETPHGLSDWQPLELSSHGRDDRPADTSTELIRAAPGITGYQLDLPGGTQAANVVTIDATTGPKSSRFAIPYTTLPDYHKQPGTKFFTRAGWGADESLRFDKDGKNLFPNEFQPVQAITVHHTAEMLSVGGDRKAAMRGIYRFQATDRGWGDIGYHLLIDPEGNLYEGRHSGDNDIFPIFASVPIRGQHPKAVTGAHVAGFNSGNIGICVMGDFTSASPTPQALETLVRIATALCKLCDIDPTGGITYVNPVSGAQRAVRSIQRHRDWAATECPGNTFAAQFADVPKRVAAALA